MSETFFLEKLVQTTSRICVARHCQNMSTAEPALAQSDEIDPSTMRMSVIVISSPIMRMSLKIHFDLDISLGLAAMGLERHESEIEDALATDFMRELSNLQAGSLRALLEKAGIQNSSSLPFVMVSDDEFGREEKQSDLLVHFRWAIVVDQIRVIHTARIELIHAGQLTNAVPKMEKLLGDLLSNESSEGGDVEFIL